MFEGTGLTAVSERTFGRTRTLARIAMEENARCPCLLFRWNGIGFNVSVQDKCVAFSNCYMGEPAFVALATSSRSAEAGAKLLGKVRRVPARAPSRPAGYLPLKDVVAKLLASGAYTLDPTFLITFVSGTLTSARIITSSTRALGLLVGASC